MNYLTWALVNGPVGVINFIINAFYIFCIVCPHRRERINSVSSSVWLNFFCYTQIVPAHRAIFIWFKENIKPIIFCILLLENIYELLNQTVDIYAIMVIIKKGHFYLSFVVMMTSSCITVVYLGMHIRRRVINGQSLSSARLSSQLRVTITGVIQGLLYFSYAVWHEYIFTSQQNLSAFISPYVRSTAVSFYMLGTTFNLGAGQSVFRQQICGAEQWYSLTVVEIQMCLSFEVNEAHCSVSDPSGRAP
ncbi:taste receptor, type 2, member 201, tandem duplicate 1 [Poecilia latipinna]|uniref:taste receptor, type 2, member 201, tandem duplicate 1 n=1 Tax=Poecilia latipinna TaxID=48699 RepID=UPI00072EEA65|nr:PREDICTED: uncharacterized protein LOC106948948 [Poecilia latipinna]